MDLRSALKINAATSVITGLLLAAAPSAVAAWLGVSIDGWIRIVGVVLLGHGAGLTWVGQQPSIEVWAKLNIAAIGPYPLILLGILLVGAVDTGLGRVLLLLDATVVGLFAGAQLLGLRAATSRMDAVAS